MICALNITDYDIINVSYGHRDINYIKNTDYFIKLYYHTHFFSMYGISILIPFTNIIKSSFLNYSKISFNVSVNNELLKTIINIEINILKNIDKQKKYLLSNEIKQGSVKTNNNIKHKNKLVLKIIGIWETDYSCGLKYKFMLI